VAGSSCGDLYAKRNPARVLFPPGGPDGPTGAGVRVIDEGDLVVTAPGDNAVDSSAWLLPGTPTGRPPSAPPDSSATPSATP
jgi:hypothetical protein